ncbi:MAG: TonB-dependent receptor, partial [Saprospiraceae bacterium]|nr:TonB-dependent receptor [Saprospiraceae bacterium]
MRKVCAPFLSFVFLYLFNPYLLTSQTRVIGKVNDLNNEPLAFANVLLLNGKDSTFLKGEIADIEGSFIISNLTPGEYICEYSMVGYARKFSPSFIIKDENGTHDLGIIVMDESIMLQSVEIVAKRAFLEQKIDRTVVNVSNSITNAGGNALEVLQRSPGVQVNRLTKTISLVGKEGVVVMINGKISRMPSDAVVQMLEGMNADNIDRIELIHTPPANFDAEGNAGIINIVLKSTGDEGLNGSYSLNAGRGRGNKYGGSINFNFRKKMVNFYGGYDHNYNLNPQIFTNYRGIRQDNDFLETSTRSDRPHTPTTVQNARMGVDLQLSKKTVVGILGSLFDRNWYMEAVNNVVYTRNGQVESRLLMPNIETNKNRSYTGNINIAHEFGSDHTLTIDADKVSFEMHNPSNYQINLADGNNGYVPQYELRLTKNTPIDVFVVKADYLFKIKNVHFETGAKYTDLKFDNDIKVDSVHQGELPVILQEYTSLAHMDENIKAGYVSISFKINQHTDFKAGLRYEYTNTQLGTAAEPKLIDRHYGSWFPSIYFTHRITDKQSLNLSFSRRIFRPQLSQLAPFLVFTDPTTLLGGNPSLQPSFTNAYKLDYTINSLKLGVSYNTEDFPISFIPTVDAKTNRQVNGFKNLESSRGA